MISRLEEKDFIVKCIDGSKGLMNLPDKSVKLIYGSPPYPNAERDYGVWSSSEYIDKMTPFIEAAKLKLCDDGFLVINVKANREKATSKTSTKRSLIVEKLAIMLEEKWGFYCVDIEIWIKDNPVPTGLRVACQDAYEQNLWFSINPKWKINIDAIRRPYDEASLKMYANNEYKPRTNGLTYVRKAKHIEPHPLGALPLNVIRGAVSAKQQQHQAVQPGYLPEKYIKATTKQGDIVVDPWMGTGTTGIEVIKNGRKFIGFDINKQYVEHAEQALNNAWEEMQMKSKVTEPRAELHRLFINSLGDAVKVASDVNVRPLEIDLIKPFPVKLRVYLFPATNPLGGRALNEYKFNLNVPGQKKGTTGNFDNSDDRIIILAAHVGDDKDTGVFILWDAYMHKDFAMNANVQTKEELILQAFASKVAVAKRKNGEIMLAARDKYLLDAIKQRLNLFCQEVNLED